MASHDLKRRTVLRAAVAAGCLLCLPQAGRAQSGVAADNTCKVVEGKVSPQGWCQLWAAKQG